MDQGIDGIKARVSALMDGEAGDLRALAHDPRARQAWFEFHAVGDALRGGGLEPSPRDAEFLSRMFTRLRLEPTPEGVAPAAAGVAAPAMPPGEVARPAPATGAGGDAPRSRRRRRPSAALAGRGAPLVAGLLGLVFAAAALLALPRSPDALAPARTAPLVAPGAAVLPAVCELPSQPPRMRRASDGAPRRLRVFPGPSRALRPRPIQAGRPPG